MPAETTISFYSNDDFSRDTNYVKYPVSDDTIYSNVSLHSFKYGLRRATVRQ